ncbi:DUF2634 domain-containing protein [Tepidanaerobacter syntrophicus]|uniref:DUF2634 domain-containing protein n=1 Tax=Tepidanaerobacter syntrophicus TaxID=224999 RepID=UPI001BD61AD0|nr:DUF2634 domain-containing protein [Tepidanaerobacter syntrophicus]
MPNLYPTFEMPELVEQQLETEPKYPKSYLFDFEKGDFVRDGAGKILVADGHTAWVQLCTKTLLTERFAYLSYSSDYGVEIEKVMKEKSRKTIETEIERTITEALLADPRTESVSDFSFEWSGDSLLVSMTATPVIGHSERIEVSYNA